MYRKFLTSMLQLGLGVMVILLVLVAAGPLSSRSSDIERDVQRAMECANIFLCSNEKEVTSYEFVSRASDATKYRVTVFDAESFRVLDDSIGNSFDQLNADVFNLEDVMEAKRLTTASEWRKESGKRIYFYSQCVPVPFSEVPKNWIIRMQAELPSTWQVLQGYMPWSLVIPFLLLVGIIGFSFWRANRLNAPIQSMLTTVTEVNQGNYDLRVEQLGDDELARLAAAFNMMTMRMKETAAMLSRTSGELTSILDTMTSGLVAVDSTMRVIHINKTAANMLGVKMDEAINRHFIDTSLNVRIESYLRTAMEQDALYQADMVVSLPKGESVLRLYISPLKHGPVVSGAISLLEDVTELRRLEQVRTDFATNVSHELKTPLTSIKGFVETLQQGAIQDPVMSGKFLNIISLEADRLGRLINDIISLNKLESGKDDLVKEPISLDEQAQVVMDMMLPHATMKSQALILEERTRDLYVLSSADHVRQLLINLVDNAIKYTPANGTIKLMIDRYGDKALIRVVDTGYGIEKEHLARLFERFYRVDKGRSRNMGGTGLGLAIVKHIVNSMDGRIDVASEVGMGSVFTVELKAYDERGNSLGSEQHSA